MESMYPGRIDLAWARTRHRPAHRTGLAPRPHTNAEQFPQDVQELQHYFAPAQAGQAIKAIPGEGTQVPIWLLGSSLFSAQLAAHLGLPFAFASHFAPEHMAEAIAVYRERFQPNQRSDKPFAMLTVNVFAADTDAEARKLFTSMQVQFVNLIRGVPGLVQPPIDDIETYWRPEEKDWVTRALARSFVGTAATIEPQLRDLINTYRPDELMISGHFFDPEARLKSVRIAAEVRERLG